MNSTIISGYTGAIFSEDRKHRFCLWRYWDMSNPKVVLFIGLNPSRGNEFYNDPTIKRCIAFAKKFGCGGMLFGNLYSLISPDPDSVKANIETASHPLNNEALLYMAQLSSQVVCCWGTWDFIALRKYAVVDMLRAAGISASCFGLNRDGSPKHPLYLKSNCTLMPFL
jgi:hypothetical protein